MSKVMLYPSHLGRRSELLYVQWTPAVYGTGFFKNLVKYTTLPWGCQVFFAKKFKIICFTNRGIYYIMKVVSCAPLCQNVRRRNMS